MAKYWFIGFCICLVLCGCSGKKYEKSAESLYHQAALAIGRSQYDEAEDLLRRSIVFNGAPRRDSALAEDYLLLGYLYDQIGQYDSVTSALQQAISVAHAIGEKMLEQRGKLTLAEFLLRARQYEKAIVNGADAATLSVWLSDWKGAYIANDIVRACQHALRRYSVEENILDSLDRIDDLRLNQMRKRDLYGTRFELLRGLSRVGDLDSFYVQWKKFALTAGDTLALINSHIKWGEVKQSMRQFDSALHAFTKALSLLNFFENVPLRAQVLASIGNISLIAGKMDDALRYYNDALFQSQQTMNLPLSEILSLQIIACEWRIHRKGAGDSTSYDVESDRIARTFADSGCRVGDPYANFLKGRIFEHRGQLVPALRNYQQALELYEKAGVFSEAGTVTSVISAFMEAERTNWFDAPLSILCSTGNSADAFELEERNNLNDLREFFLQLPVVLRHGDFNQHITSLQWKRDKELMVQREIFKELEGRAGHNAVRVQKLCERISDPGLTASDSSAGTNQFPEQYRWMFHPPVLSMKQIQDSLQGADALVIYVPVAKTLYSIVVRHDTSFICKSNVDREYLMSIMNEYCGLVGRADSSGSKSSIQGAVGRINTLSAILFSHLFSPIQSKINSGGKLYFVQNKAMGWFPIHTIRGEGGFLISRYRVRYLPTSAVLLFQSAPLKRSEQITAVGHPGRTGWDVEYELKDIRAFSKDVKLFFDTSANIEHFRSLPCDVLHVCSEFTLSQDVPERSVFYLSDGVTISGIQEKSLGEIFSVPPPQTLLFSNISFVPGNMARYAPMAFLVNGSAVVIVTMWQGDHKTKKYFGEAFYSGLQTGLNSDEAYERSAKKLSTDKEFSSPRQWGLYFLFGK